MSDLSITQKFNMPIATPQFRSSNTTPITSVPQKENKGLSTGAKVAIGTGLVALASYGIYVATRGKVKPKTTPPVTTNNPVQEIKELAVSAFKEAGNKFVKGKAVMADGTNYTGKIVSEGKDGSKVVMEYLDGVLQKSTKTKGADTIFEKTYKYSKELGLEEVIKNGETTFKKYIDETGFLNILNSKHLISINPEMGYVKVNGKIANKQPKGIFIDNEAGLIRKGNLYIDIETGSSLVMGKPKVTYSRNGDKPTYLVKLNGRVIPDNIEVFEGNLPSKNTLVIHKVRAKSHNGETPGDLSVRTEYLYDETGKYARRYKFEGAYGQYDDLMFNYTDGTVQNGKDVLFKYNPRSKELSALTIDKELAKQIVDFGETQFKFIKRATKDWQKRN